ncbi:nuclease [Candidatus Electronema sp. PJ]|uniref:nuclease n=1 Tax=Candidatus Electronema sp. PJ TaxID=3401572 RepID=UPI003AA90871
MSFRVIKGTFHVAGYSADGDSVRFKADDDGHWGKVFGRVRLNARGHAQLRIEAIDTLETHFMDEHQPRELADAAADQLFQLLGIKDAVWNADRSKVMSAQEGTRGCIATRMAEKYGRPVSFVFAGEDAFADGQEIFLDRELAAKSVNYQLLSGGFAYPTFYDGMFYDIRELFAEAAAQARAAQAGIWSGDTTNAYFQVNGLADITEEHVILPKLFRRITAHLKENGSYDPHAFIASLREQPEQVLILSILHFTHFDNLLSVDGNGKIKLKQRPENLVFLG